MVARALGDAGFMEFQSEQGVRENIFTLRKPDGSHCVDAAWLARQSGAGEAARRTPKLIEDIFGYLHLLSDEAHIRAVIREEMQKLGDKYGNARRTEISEDELSDVDKEDLIPEEMMVVTLSQRGYIKRLPIHTYQAQNRGGRGIMGAKADDEDPSRICSFPALMTGCCSLLIKDASSGKKSMICPCRAGQVKAALWSTCFRFRRVSRSRHVLTRVRLKKIVTRDGHRAGIVKKTSLDAYKRPTKGGIIAINLKDGDALIEARIVSAHEDILLSTANGMAIRFSQADARAMGRNTSGVRGINSEKNDEVIGMVVADPAMTLLSMCEKGYGKRTPFGFYRISSRRRRRDPSEDSVVADEEIAEALLKKRC